MEAKKDKKRMMIKDLLQAHPESLTIQEIVDKTGLARHTVMARLHRLGGEGKLEVRQINMAKLHKWKDQEDQKPFSEKEAENKAYKQLELTKLKEYHITKLPKKEQKQEPTKSPKIDLKKIKEEIEKELRGGVIKKHEADLRLQRAPLHHTLKQTKHLQKKLTPAKYINTGIPGFDDLLETGIPKGVSVLVAGRAGSGKTIFCLQTLYHHAQEGKNCLYMSFEELEKRLIRQMEDFGWDPAKFIKNGNLLIKRFNPFDITRSVDALLTKAKGELLIDVQPIIFPDNFKPDLIVVDSLSAIASAFNDKEDSFRIYVEQLFKFFEQIDATAFLITETKQILKIFSATRAEEFLADGVFVLYNVKKGNIQENAIEILKLRGAKYQKKIVAMQISDQGITVYPEQEVPRGLEGS